MRCHVVRDMKKQSTHTLEQAASAHYMRTTDSDEFNSVKCRIRKYQRLPITCGEAAPNLPDVVA